MKTESLEKKLSILEELLVDNMIEIQALTRLMMEKGIIDQHEHLETLQKVRANYENCRRT